MIPPLMRRVLFAAGPFFVLIGLMLILRIAVGPTFFNHFNLHSILQQTLIVATGAVGMTIIIVGGGIDLSCGSAVALTSMATAWTLRSEGLPDWCAIPAAIGMGVIIGAFNGALVAGLRLTPFIVTLGTMGIARGVAKWIGDEQPINYGSSWIDDVMKRPPKPKGDDSFLAWFSLPTSGWILIALIVLVAVIMRQTTFGRRVYAIGSNEAAARLCGIRVGWNKLAMYALAGACFGLAGLFQTARLRQGDPSTAMGLELDIIAAVIIGGASLTGGSGTVMGSIIGAFLMSVLRNGTDQLGWPNFVQEVLIGASIIIGAGLDRLRHTQRFR
jgi:ribose transport system permease protein